MTCLTSVAIKLVMIIGP